MAEVGLRIDSGYTGAEDGGLRARGMGEGWGCAGGGEGDAETGGRGGGLVGGGFFGVLVNIKVEFGENVGD